MQRRRGIGCDTWSRSSSKCPRGTAARKPVRFREIRHRGRSSYSPDPAVRFSLLYAAKKRAHLLRRSISPNIFQPDYFAIIYRRKFKFSVRLRYIHTCVYVCVYTYIYKGCSARERKKRKTRDGIFIERSLFAQGRCCPPLHPQSNLSIPSKGTRENYPSACLANVIDNSLRREYTDNYLFALTKVLVIVSTFLESIRLPEYRRVRRFLSRQKKNRTTPSSIFQNIVHFETPIPTRACAAIPTAFH